MPRVIFDRNFDWHAQPNVTVAYKAGCEYPVTQRCADEAVAAGKGRIVAVARRKGVADAGR